MRALFCSLDSPGFLFPAIGLAEALRERGHRVAFAANRRTEARLGRAGLTRLPCGRRDGPSFETSQWSRPFAAAMQLRHIEHAMAVFAPDVIIGQALALGPLLARERHGIPVAVLGPATALWPGTSSPAAEQRRAWRHLELMRAWTGARSLVRLPAAPAPRPGGSGGDPLLGDLFMLRSIAELHGGAPLPPHVHLVGACSWQPGDADAQVLAWIGAARRGGRPIVSAHHRGTTAGRGFWLALAAAAGSLGLRVAGAAGDLEVPVAKTPVHESFLLRTGVEPGWILPFADLMVGSASSAAVLAALTCGVRCLMVAAGSEQHDLAEQVERAGAGRLLAPDEVTPAGMRQALAAILGDSSAGRRARALAQAFARVDGFGLAADLVEGLGGATVAAGATIATGATGAQGATGGVAALVSRTADSLTQPRSNPALWPTQA